MGFADYINDEHKIRIALSDKALITITDDMNIFSETKISGFINTIFENFRSEATSSTSLYLERYGIEIDNLLSSLDLDNDYKEVLKENLLDNEHKNLITIVKKYKQNKSNNRLYHINKDNVNFLITTNFHNNYQKEIFNNSPGLYMKCVIEEYCSLPFIKRERIYQKKFYDDIKKACKESLILKLTTLYQGKPQTFVVYPYKIVSDPSDTQEYLACYSRKDTEKDKDKVLASFAIARLIDITVLKSTFYLNAKEISYINDSITKYSSAYLLGKPEEIHVRLTEKGKKLYQNKLYSRPTRNVNLSYDDVYVFFCSEHQIFNYFFPFGKDAEIIKPLKLRKEFKEAYTDALDVYTTITNE